MNTERDQKIQDLENELIAIVEDIEKAAEGNIFRADNFSQLEFRLRDLRRAVDDFQTRYGQHEEAGMIKTLAVRGSALLDKADSHKFI